MPSEHRTFPRLHKLPYALMKHIQEVRVQHKDQRKKWEKNLQKEWMKQLSEMHKNFSHLRPPKNVVKSTWLAEPLALFTTEYSTFPYFLKGPEAAGLRWELVVAVRKAVRDMDSTSSTWQGAARSLHRLRAFGKSCGGFHAPFLSRGTRGLCFRVSRAGRKAFQREKSLRSVPIRLGRPCSFEESDRETAIRTPNVLRSHQRNLDSLRSEFIRSESGRVGSFHVRYLRPPRPPIGRWLLWRQ